MQKYLEIALGFLGVGAGAGAAVAIFLWLAKGALVRALDHAAALEMARYRSTFERELEKDRQEAEARLERYKQELSFGSEVRRVAAARKVDALIAIMHDTEPLIRKVVGQDDPEARAKAMQAVLANLVIVRTHEYLLTPELTSVLHGYRVTLLREHRLFNEGDSGALSRATAACHELINEIRKELGVV